MELPARLSAAIGELTRDTSPAGLQQAGEGLSRRYRAELRDGRMHLADETAALAYAAARMPATFAAVRACMTRIAEAAPDLALRTLLDVGAGPGTAFFAARDAFAIESATLVEASAPIRAVCERLVEAGADVRPTVLAADLASVVLDEVADADLVTLAYVLDEIDPAARTALVERLWRRTRRVLLVVEPGTPAGWRRILAVREALLSAGAHVLAPCPHVHPCPVEAPDWCHFAQRLPRTKLHRTIKSGEAPFEDEKYVYVAFARDAPAEVPPARVLATPRAASGRVSLKLCEPDGSLAHRLITKREGEAFRVARRLDWGDAFEG